MKKRRSLTGTLVIYVLLMILPVNVLLIYLAQTTQEVSRATVQTSLENIGQVYMAQVQRRMENINSLIWTLESSDRNLKIINEEDDRDAYYIAAMGLRQTLNEHLRAYEDADGYFFFSEKVEEGMTVENSARVTASVFRDSVFADRAILADSRWQVRNIGDNQWYIHTNHWRNVYLGAGIQLDLLAEKARNSLIYDSARVYFSEDSAGSDLSDVFAAVIPLGRRELFLHVEVDRAEVVSRLPLLQRLSYGLAFAWLGLIPLLIWLIHRLVLWPLRTIRQGIQSFQRNPEERITRQGNTADFEQVNQSFNAMADQIVTLKIDNYEREIQRQKLELRNLRLQIKPHFLFNSLNLMYNLVQMGETKSVQQMLLYFSDYFRYINVGDRDFSLFRDELELIQKYIEVAKIRYPSLIEAEFDVSEEALEAQIPQLMVHNFVENIVKHGLDLSRTNHIHLRAWLEGTDLITRIEDDGVGMAEMQAERVNQGIFEFEDGKRHLGLKNSYRRIQFYYGEKGSLQIVSRPEEGTSVTLRFPSRRGEEIS